MPTTTTVRPNQTPIGASNFAITGGAASINAALSDNLVATYVTKSSTGNGTVTVAFGTTSIASGSKVTQVRLRAQVLCPTSSSRLVLTPITRVNGVDYAGSALTFSGAYSLAEYAGAYFTTAPDGYAWDQDRIDGLRCRIGDNATGADLSNVYELFFDIQATTQPTITLTAPVSPVTDTSKPTVAWSFSDSDGYDQDYYRVKVFPSSQFAVGGFDPSVDTPLWDSGVVASGDNTALIDYFLTDGVTYRVYVIAAKTVSGEAFYSTYEYQQFTVNTVPPSTPSLSASFNQANNYVWLSASGQSISGSFDSQVFQVQRSDDSGTTWADVIGGSSLVPSGSFLSVLFDYAAPRAVTCGYRVRSVGTLSGELVSSNWSATQNVSVLNDGTWWLKAITEPTLNAGNVPVQGGFDVDREEQVGVFRPLGRPTAVVVTAGLMGEDGSLTIRTGTRAAFESAWAVCSHVGTLLMQTPDGDQRFIRITERGYERDGRVASPLTTITVKYVEVAV
jgi:hypothetical protein